uniref:FERM domain-containing protein n=1 Tax=Elaeophora elaphi TaxID=1147741 RepID=A0A0R3RKS2_9BILA
MEIAILEKFITCRGQSPAIAEINYLNKAKWIELYGVDMHTVEGKDGNLYSLGLTPTGMLVFDGSQKIGLFLWEKIQKLDFKNRKITLVVEEDADQASGQVQLHTFVFNLSSHKACKHLWKCAIEHHTFFRLKYHKPRITKASQLFRLGSTFRYRGRTEYENVHKDGGRLSRRQSATFERRPSQRYGPRQSLVNKRIQIRNDFKKQVSASAGLSVPDLISSPEGSCIAANNDKHILISNGIGNNDIAPAINGYANLSQVDTLFNKDATCHDEINDIKELDKSPSASRKQYASAKDPAHSRSTPLQFMDNMKKSNTVDTTLNIAHEPAPRWSGSPASITTVTRPVTSHVTRIAISSNGSHSMQDKSITHNPISNSNSAPPVEHIPSVSTATLNVRQSLIPRNFSENSPAMKSSGSSVSSSTTPTSTCKTSPSKAYTGSLIHSPLSTIKPNLNQTYVVLPEKENFQNSTVINGHAISTVTIDGSSIRQPSIINDHQDKHIPVTAPSSSEVVRTATFTINDRKLFEKAEYDSKSGESNTVSVSRLPEPQSRIPHLRTAKYPTTTPMKKVYVPSASAVQTSTVNLEGAVGDRTYRSRLPVRSSHTGGSSITAADTHGSRTACDEVYLIYLCL